MNISRCNPFIRAAMIQPAIMEGRGFRYAYDHRVFFVLENEGFFISEQGERKVVPDDLIFVPPFSGYYFKGRMKVAVINFDAGRDADNRKDPICPPPMEDFKKELVFMEERVDGLEEVSVISTDAIWRSRVIKIVEGFDCYDPVKDAESSAALKSLLVSLYQRLYLPDDTEKALAKKLDVYIKINAPQIKDNGSLAAVFGYHPVYLSEVYKKHFGLSLHKAVVLYRIENACRWLLQTDQSVEEIAFASGFSSRNHFCTAFKKQRGLSPNTFRKKKKI